MVPYQIECVAFSSKRLMLELIVNNVMILPKAGTYSAI
jgi:hypothetical protein